VKIAVGADHAGFRYKEEVRAFVARLGHDVHDFGTFSEEPVDYPKFIRPVAEAVAGGAFERGIVAGGSGNGEAIVANKVRGIRCAVCWTKESARLSRAHNDANAMSIGARTVSLELALEMIDIWLATPFDGGRHARRVQKIADLDTCSLAPLPAKKR
jgi:ribose 5-phosphate isomerase B